MNASVLLDAFRPGLKSFSLTIATLLVAPAAHAAEANEDGQTQSKAEQIAFVETSVERTRPVVEQAFLGKAPWICTPSGFGTKAKCFSRASLQRRR